MLISPFLQSGGSLTRYLVTMSSLAITFDSTRAAETVEWWLDTNEVMVGGPVCVTFARLPQRLWSDVEVEVSGHRPFCPDLRGDDRANGQVICLLWQSSPEEWIEASPDITHLRRTPLFGEPGISTISVVIAGQRCGEDRVEVVPLAPNAKPAIDLLYPEIDTTNPDRFKKLAWPSVIISSGKKVSVAELNWLRESYADITQHPDWRDIASALLWQFELTTQLDELGNRAKPSQASQQDVVAYRARLAETLTVDDTNEYRRIAALVRASSPKSPFAELTLTWTEEGLRHIERGLYGFKVDLPAPSRPVTTATSAGTSEPRKRISAIVLTSRPATQPIATSRADGDFRTSDPEGTSTRIELTNKIRSTQPAAQPTTKPSDAPTK
mgnify:CR=1 FL=1